MQWFLALTEGCIGFPNYSKLVKVAVHTALQRTALQPHFLYDGGENDLTRWLRDRDVPVIPCESFLAGEIATLVCGERETNIRAALRGILLRIELPQLGEKLGLDERVLYTDCDVFFRRDVVPELAAIDCRYFAVAPEFERADYRQMNTGVMWMNLAELRRVDSDFREFVRQNLPRLQASAWDQGAYREFFALPNEQFQWNKLRPELNWKPYWGENIESAIIHFHGPKPYQRPHLDSHFAELKPLARAAYDHYTAEWLALLDEAG